LRNTAHETKFLKNSIPLKKGFNSVKKREISKGKMTASPTIPCVCTFLLHVTRVYQFSLFYIHSTADLSLIWKKSEDLQMCLALHKFKSSVLHLEPGRRVEVAGTQGCNLCAAGT